MEYRSIPPLYREIIPEKKEKKLLMHEREPRKKIQLKYDPRIWKNLGERHFGQKYEVRQECVIGTRCPWEDEFTREHHAHYLIRYKTLADENYTKEPWSETPKTPEPVPKQSN